MLRALLLLLFLAPYAPAVYTPDENNTVPRELAGVRVLFDGIPAPVLYVSSNQINVVSPFAISGRSATVIRVRREGLEVSATREVWDTALAMFRDTAVFHTNPGGAVTMTLLATGAGLMAPLPMDGSLGNGGTRIAGNFTAEFVIGTGVLAVYRYTLPVAVSDVPGVVQGVVQLTIDIGNHPLGLGCHVHIGVDNLPCY